MTLQDFLDLILFGCAEGVKVEGVQCIVSEG